MRAVVAVGPLPAEVVAATEINKIEPSTVESVKVVEVSFAVGVATWLQFTPSELV
jgi:hypothetical protein